MLCGTGSFKHVDGDPAEESPKPRKRRHGGNRASNPFAARGLDKFSTVRSDLESRREKILRCVGSDSGLVMVRFVRCNSSWAPIVVKLPDEQKLKDAAAPKKVLAKTSTPSSTQAAATSCTPPDPASPRDGAARRATARGMEPARRTSFSRRRLRPPACYWPAVMVLLTLLSLAAFGRAFAICCTAISWYLVPTLRSSCSNGADLRGSMGEEEGRLTADQTTPRGARAQLAEKPCQTEQMYCAKSLNC